MLSKFIDILVSSLDFLTILKDFTKGTVSLFYSDVDRISNLCWIFITICVVVSACVVIMFIGMIAALLL